MSGLARTTDIGWPARLVRLGPEADIGNPKKRVQVRSPLRRPDRRPDVLRTRQARSRRLRRVRRRKQVAPVRSRTHLVNRRRADEIATLAYLPSAPECPKHRSEAEWNVGRGAGQAVLRLKEILFSGQNGGERRPALFILLKRDPEGAICRINAAAQVCCLVPGLQVCRKPVVHLLLGAQHCVLIVDQQLLELGILQANVVGDLPVVDPAGIAIARLRQTSMGCRAASHRSEIG